MWVETLRVTESALTEEEDEEVEEEEEEEKEKEKFWSYCFGPSVQLNWGEPILFFFQYIINEPDHF